MKPIIKIGIPAISKHLDDLSEDEIKNTIESVIEYI